MGDVHFILRHALTGGICLLFIVIGCWAVDGPGTRETLHYLLNLNGATAALLAAVPILGITIQGAHILALDGFGRLFTDPARKVVGAQVKDMVKPRIRDGAGADDIWKVIFRAPDDAIFVWLYHSHANSDLIEWARTRRSYYYLGVNWVAAAAFGFFCGLVGSSIGERPRVWQIVAVAGVLAWLFGAFRAAQIMKRDADTMEAMWAAARSDEVFRSQLGQSFGLDLQAMPRPDARKANPAPDLP
ncbi:MAG TPA: hypothetical protein VGW34_16040 [Allosphingosinicella sp.]|nr:hypothetical protein [Allosphingosinicella sp.]